MDVLHVLFAQIDVLSTLLCFDREQIETINQTPEKEGKGERRGKPTI